MLAVKMSCQCVLYILSNSLDFKKQDVFCLSLHVENNVRDVICLHMHRDI